MEININYVLTRGVNEILPNKLALQNLMGERKITLYQGFDPTAESLHVGHFIGVRKLSQFQKLGHKVIFLIGDFTAKIGDPTDKGAARVMLTDEQIKNNLSNYVEQIKNILSFEGENAAEVKYNSEWLSKLTFSEILDISSNFTVQQMQERSMFKERIKSDKPIYLHEFLYPVMQGYDSVAMEVDLEVGGNDQLFNMMSGRTLIKNLKDKEKYVLTTKLLEDANGNKMGKTTGNALNLTDTPEDMFGKIMSLTDSMIAPGYELLTDIDYKPTDPMSDKKALAYDVIRQIKGLEAAEKAKNYFENTYQNNSPEYNQKVSLKDNFVSTIAEAAKVSNSEAKRLIFQNAVSVNDERVTNIVHDLKSGDKIKIGTRTFVEVE